MGSYYYYVTSKQSSVVRNAVRLVDHLHTNESGTPKYYLVLARSATLDFYEDVGIADSCRLPDGTLQAVPLFSVDLYTTVEKMMHWSPPLPCTDSKHDITQQLSSMNQQCLEHYQEGLLLLSEQLSLFLVVPDYRSRCIRLISSIHLDGCQGYRTDGEPLLAIDPCYQFLCVHVHKMSLQLIYLQRRLYTPEVRTVWKLLPPVLVRLPRIYPVAVLLTAGPGPCSSEASNIEKEASSSLVPHNIGSEKLGNDSASSSNAVPESGTSGQSPLTAESRLQTAGLEKESKRHKPGGSPLAFASPRNDVTGTLSVENHQNSEKLRSPLLMLLYEANDSRVGNGDAVSRFLCCIDTSSLASGDFEEALWRAMSVRVPSTADQLAETINGEFFVFSKTHVELYSIKPNSPPVSEFLATYPNNRPLQPPLQLVSVDYSKHCWLAGDATGYLLLVSLEPVLSCVSRSSGAKASSYRISFAPLGNYSPVSCLALCHSEALSVADISKRATGCTVRTATVAPADLYRMQSPLHIFLGSKTGDSLFLELCLNTTGVVLGFEHATTVQRIPNFGPIVDIAHWSGPEDTHRHLILASGYAQTGSLRLVSDGVTFTPLLAKPITTTRSSLTVVTQGRFDTSFDALLLFETSLFSTRVLRLYHNASTAKHMVPPALTLESCCELTTLCAEYPCLFVANVYLYTLLVYVTPKTVSFFDANTLSLRRRKKSADTKEIEEIWAEVAPEANASVCALAVGDGPFLVLCHGNFVVILQFYNDAGDYVFVGCLKLDDEVKAADMVAKNGLLLVTDWSGKLSLYRIQPLLLDGNKAVEARSNQVQFRCHCAFSTPLATPSGDPMVASSVALFYLASCNVIPKPPDPVSCSFQLTDPVLVASVGFLEGSLLCLHLREMDENYVVVDEQRFTPAKTAVTLRKVPYCPPNGHICYGLIALCDAPIILFSGRVLRLQTTQLANHDVLDAVAWDFNVCALLIKAARDNQLSESDTTLTTSDGKFGFVEETKDDVNLMFAWISSPSQHPLTDGQLHIGATGGIQKIQVKTIHLGVSPEKVVFHKSSGFIIAAAVDEFDNWSYHKTTTKPMGCLFVAHPRLDFLSRYDLGVREYPSALLTASVGPEKRELLILATVSIGRASQGQLRVLDIIMSANEVPHSRSTSCSVASNAIRVFRDKRSATAAGPPLSCGNASRSPFNLLCLEHLEAVSAAAQVDNLLVVACPNKIRLFYIIVTSPSSGGSQKTDITVTLRCISVYSAHCYVHTLDVFRSSVLMAHVSRSVGIYTLKKQSNSAKAAANALDCVALEERALDYNPAWSTAACFHASETQALMTDDAKNIVALAQCVSPPDAKNGYLPVPLPQTIAERAAAKNVELQPVGRFHTGLSIHRLLTVPSLALRLKEKKQYWQKFRGASTDSAQDNHSTNSSSSIFFNCGTSQTFWSSSQGAFGVIFELPKHCFKRLQTLQNAIYDVLPSPLGLKLSTFRDFISHPHRIPHHGFIDGDAIEAFLNLPYTQQLAALNHLQKTHLNDFPSLPGLLQELEELQRSHI